MAKTLAAPPVGVAELVDAPPGWAARLGAVAERVDPALVPAIGVVATVAAGAVQAAAPMAPSTPVAATMTMRREARRPPRSGWSTAPSGVASRSASLCGGCCS